MAEMCVPLWLLKQMIGLAGGAGYRHLSRYRLSPKSYIEEVKSRARRKINRDETDTNSYKIKQETGTIKPKHLTANISQKYYLNTNA